MRTSAFAGTSLLVPATFTATARAAPIVTDTTVGSVAGPASATLLLAAAGGGGAAY